jgi:hypothetical protein
MTVNHSNRFGQLNVITLIVRRQLPAMPTVVAMHQENDPRIIPAVHVKEATETMQHPADLEMRHCYTQPSSWGFPDGVTNTFKIHHIKR